MVSRSSIIRRLFAPLGRLFLRLVPTAEHWERYELQIEHRKFGHGSITRFKWYFEGASRVRVTSVDEVREWLIGCQYESDESLFASSDHWQHPADFERLKRGDCEDHALWAWRKLVELGVDAEFVVGRYATASVESHGHAWVIYRDEAGTEHLMEAVAKDSAHMIRPLASARAEYVPHFAVSREYQTIAFGGYLEDMKARGRKAKPVGTP
jgi:hypothetical protein